MNNNYAGNALSVGRALNLAETSGNSPPGHARLPEQSDPNFERTLADETLSLFEHTRPRRTAGLRIFDWAAYSLNNIVVFGASVVLTYLTLRGGDKLADGTFKHGKISRGIHHRADWLMGKLEKPLGRKGAEYGNMVFWSFVDGSIFSVMIKLLENKRSQIAQWIDEKLGQKHPDPNVYEAEPHQTWNSVLSGRALTMAVVLPTAVTLSKLKINGDSLNEHLFYKNGEKLAKAVEKSPALAKAFGKWDVKTIGRVSAFELFYTSVCTIGLYFTSRLIARRSEHKEKKQELIEELRNIVQPDATKHATSVVPNALSPTPDTTADATPKPPAQPQPAPIATPQNTLPSSAIMHASPHGRVQNAALGLHQPAQ